MKKTINTILALCLALFAVSCSDENEEARTPVANFTIDTQELTVGQSMTIKFAGVADYKAIFTGDAGHNYDKQLSEKNTGVPMPKNIFTYSYSSPGTYHVVCVATTADSYMGRNEKTDTIGFDVRVTDDATRITQLYSYVYPNTFAAREINDSEWVLNYPTKQVYNNREITLNAKRQFLSFELMSDSSKVYVDDVLWTAKTRYDFTKTLSIHVVSMSGAARDYKLFTIIYPEFESFKVGEVEAKQVRSAYYPDLLTYTLKLPEGTDPKNVRPDFVLEGSDVKLFAGTSEVKSGQTIDLTLPEGTYTLVRTSAANAKATATTRVRFELQ